MNLRFAYRIVAARFGFYIWFFDLTESAQKLKKSFQIRGAIALQ